MTEKSQPTTETIHTGDCLEVLSTIPESSVHMCMTSPPYFGLRDYDTEGQIGLEDNLDDYISKLVAVGDKLRRVLRDDGSWWLNLGDSYSDNKQKMLVPHRVAIALQETGWVVRNDATWVKSNPMPQSVKDRLNTTTEQIFHLTPEPDYWYDLDAIREPYAEKTNVAKKNGHSVSGEKRTRDDSPGNHDEGGLYAKSREEQMNPAGKNPGDVFETTTEQFSGAHFAVYPAELCEKPIKSSCPPKVCADCAAPYEREVENKGLGGEAVIQDNERPAAEERDVSESSLLRTNGRTWREREFKGWSQICDCNTNKTDPGIALDPFAGAGTTCLKAKELGRRFIGIELNPEYADMARSRIGLDEVEPSRVRDDPKQHGLEGFRK